VDKGWFRVIVNMNLISGSLIGEFKPKKGIRQSDPLVPFLFLITVEGLFGTVRETKGLFEAIKVGKGDVNISVMKYVDDIIFICKANTQIIMVVKSILRCWLS